MDKTDEFWRQYAAKKHKITQIERYIEHRSPDAILRFIRLGGGTSLGCACESLAKLRFSSLLKRNSGKTETEYDHIIRIRNRELYIEQKSAGHWSDADYKWQHIAMDHKWHILLLCGIHYDGVYFWALSRPMARILIAANKITNQGNKKGTSAQGMWCNYSAILSHLVPIHTNEDLLQFCQHLADADV
jgi:hypothetical protein